MNTQEFNSRSEAVFGGRGWKTRLAAATGKDYSTVKRWADGSIPVPEYAASIVELLELIPEPFRPEKFLPPSRRVG